MRVKHNIRLIAASFVLSTAIPTTTMSAANILLIIGDDMGVETLMWGSDYPHGDGVWPESSRYIKEQFGHLPKDTFRKITCENAGKFYGLM